MVISRRVMHLGFAGVALICAGMTISRGIALLRVVRVNDAIQSVSARGRGSLPSQTEPAQVTLARALALARAGELDPAVREFSRLTVGGAADATSRAALFDLGNLYLRRAMALQGENALAALPFVELAKQRYRDLLRIDPEQWDARYNLERALRLAPEAQSVFGDTGKDPVQRPNMEPRDAIAPELP